MDNATPPFFSALAASRLQGALSAFTASLETEDSESLKELTPPQVRYVQTHGVRVPVVCQCLTEWPDDIATGDIATSISVNAKQAGAIIICQLHYRGWRGPHNLLSGFVRQADGSSKKLEQTQLKQLAKIISH